MLSRSARAVDLLEGIERTGELVFPIAWDAMIDLVKVAGDYTTHGFRSSFRSWAGESTSF
jgi:hypothetical protein